jgi:hypothetical protein
MHALTLTEDKIAILEVSIDTQLGVLKTLLDENFQSNWTPEFNHIFHDTMYKMAHDQSGFLCQRKYIVDNGIVTQKTPTQFLGKQREILNLFYQRFSAFKVSMEKSGR